MGYKLNAVALLSTFVVLTGCGGGSKDSYHSVNQISTVELAQIAAAIQSAKTSFDVVMYDGQAVIGSTLENGDGNKKISCRSGSYQVTPNTKTNYGEDGLLINNDCLTTTSKWDGVIDLECLDAKCEKSITTATSATWGDRNRKVDLSINGEMLSDITRDAFKGTASISINGKKTNFDFADIGLIQEYYNNGLTDGLGQLRIMNGKNNRCIDGTYGYDVTSKLMSENGSLRAVGGEIRILDAKDRELGEVKFEYDGAVTVYTRDGQKEFISASRFESYCGLAEAYQFSTY